MIFAAIGDTSYDIIYLLHILTVVVAFAAGWVNPRLGAFAAKSDEGTRRGLGTVMANTTMQIHLPALVLAGFFGLALILLSDEIFEFSQMWISLAFLLWFAMIGVMFGVQVPAQRRLAEGVVGAEKKLAMSTGIIHLLFLLMLIDMVWKPGL